MRPEVFDHARVGGGGGGEERGTVGHGLQDAGEAAVIGPEVVSPVGDAVRLVYDEQADGRQGLRREVVASQSFGRHQQGVHVVIVQGLVEVVPVLLVGRVDADGAQAESSGGFDLVSHEGEQGRDDDGGSVSPVSEDTGGDEIDGAFSPPGGLHDEQARAAVDEGADGIPLAVSELCVGVVEGLSEQARTRSCRVLGCWGVRWRFMDVFLRVGLVVGCRMPERLCLDWRGVPSTCARWVREVLPDTREMVSAPFPAGFFPSLAEGKILPGGAGGRGLDCGRVE